MLNLFDHPGRLALIACDAACGIDVGGHEAAVAELSAQLRALSERLENAVADPCGLAFMADVFSGLDQRPRSINDLRQRLSAGADMLEHGRAGSEGIALCLAISQAATTASAARRRSVLVV